MRLTATERGFIEVDDEGEGLNGFTIQRICTATFQAEQ